MTPMEKVVSYLRLAAQSGTYSGLLETAGASAYVQRCTAAYHRPDGGDGLIFTRDTGHHASGWWKNPDYERCLHLSVSFFYPTGAPAPFEQQRALRWSRMFFGDFTRWVWVERAYTSQGKARDVHHYRLFCDAAWQPIKPRGEIYSKDFTEAGWRSFGEIHGAVASHFKHAMGGSA